MSVRGYSSLRYAVPGYTFILLVVTVNFVPLYTLLGKQGNLTELASVLGALLALLSGSAIGFLVGQPWWWGFHKRGGLTQFRCVQHLRATRHLVSDTKVILHVFDYVPHAGTHSDSQKRGLSLYLFRRWDMHVLLSCTMAALVLETVAGFLIRIFMEIYVFQSSVFNALARLDFQPILGSGESWLLMGILGIAIVLFYFLCSERLWTKEEYERMHETVVNRQGPTKAELMSIFPDDYFTDLKNSA
jgi:hypothetical protein